MPDAYIIGPKGVKGFNIAQAIEHGWVDIDPTTSKKVTPAVAYTEVGWYKRCIDIRGKAIASLPWSITRAGGEDPIFQNTESMPAGWEWWKPQDILYRVEAALALVGAAYAMAPRAGRRIEGIRWYSPTTIAPDFQGPKDDMGEFTRFVRTVNGQTRHLDREDVLHWFAPDPLTEQGPGRSDGGAAGVHAQILDDLAGYTSEQLRSGLVKKTVFIAGTEGRQPDEVAKKKIRYELGNWLLGRNKEAAFIMSGDVKPTEIGSDLSSLKDEAISKEQREAIATTLGVPHSLVMSNAANFATAQADQYNFITTTVAFQAHLIAETLNAQLLRPVLGVELRFDIDRLEVMQTLEVEKAQRLAQLVVSGILTVDEARESLGYEAIGVSTLVTPEPSTDIPGVVDAPDEDAPEDQRSLDLDRWRRKIENRGDPTVKFIPDHLSEDEANVVRERIKARLPLDEVFKEPLSFL